MKRYVTLKEIVEDEEMFDCVLKKVLFHYLLKNPNEYIRLNNLSLKRLHRPLEYHIQVKRPRYHVIVEE